jgi:glycosyltransferase involved in cell wall biosynthesis
MRIGIYSKFTTCGGSEFRCTELANGIVRYTEHEAFLLSEGGIPERILEAVDDRVGVRAYMARSKDTAAFLYGLDSLVVVNSDSRRFTRAEYWLGGEKERGLAIDLTRIRGLVFLFNYIVNPASCISSLLPHVQNIRIITANRRFFDELSAKETYRSIRHLPRFVLESPIDPESVTTGKAPSNTVRIGQYSVGREDKFNEELVSLVARLNDRYGTFISWHFMGLPPSRAAALVRHPNVTIKKAFEEPIGAFLGHLDIFLFYPSWRRQEVWSRSVAEALASGCPVLATDKAGNREQIVHGNNGFLCRRLDDFLQYLALLIENPRDIRTLGENAALYSRFFSTKSVVSRLVEFVR